MTGNDNQNPSRLSEAALSDLGLPAQPFEDDRNRDLMNNSSSQSIRSEIEQQLKHGELLHLLIGPSGSGKSVLLSQLVRQNKDYLKPYIARGDSNFEARSFLAAVLGQFDDQEAKSVAEHIERLIPHFDKLNSNQTTPALIIDNAHLAPIEEIAELIGLMPSLQLDGKPVARLLLTGIAAFQGELDALGGEFEITPYGVSAIPALTVERTRDYLAFRFNQAGFVGEFPFTDNAVTRIQQNADGIPAAINEHATTYLNKVYTGSGVAAASGVEGGLIGALGWPVIGLGAAALALIVWGLSMFGSGDTSPDDTLAAIDDTTTTPVVSTPAATQPSNTTTVAAGAADLLRPEHRDDAAAGSQVPSSAEQPQTIGTVADGNGSTTQTGTALPQTQQQISDAGDKERVDEADFGENLVDNNTVEPQVAPTEQQEDTAATTGSDNSDTAAVEAESTTDVEAVQLDAETATESQPTNAAATNAAATNAAAEVAAVKPQPEPQPETQPTESSVVVPVTEQADSDTDAVSTTTVSDGTSDDGTSDDGTSDDGTSDDGTSDDGVAVDVTEPEVPHVPRAVENERWVLFQPVTKFTLQLATSRERDYIVEFAQKLPLDGPLAVYPFVIKSNGRQVYGLLNGLFNTTDEALAAINQMPAEVRKYKPWIRPIKQLQEEIKNAQ